MLVLLYHCGREAGLDRPVLSACCTLTGLHTMGEGTIVCALPVLNIPIPTIYLTILGRITIGWVIR